MVDPASATSFALLLPAMAARAETVGVAKARMPALTLFTLAVLAGAFIALGGVAAALRLGFLQPVALGVLCNVLVCLAVRLTYSATADRVLAIVPPIATFVAAGLEHSVVPMDFVPRARLLARVDSDVVARAGLGARADDVGWGAFPLGNLVPVTLGHVIGGAVLGGLVYRFVRLRGRAPQPPG